jgi:Zn-dependent protease/predicted transcriptional regulator
MRGVATLWRIGDIPVRVHMNWLVILGVLTWSLSVGYFPRLLPDLPPVAYWAQGLLSAFLLFVTVFLHELSHAVAARSYGLPVCGITLHIFGGVSELEREPPRPGVEFVVAIVGPLTSFAIAAVLALAMSFLPLPAAAAAVVTYLILVNVVLGVFNLLPGFPLDGGRLLRAALWKLKGDHQWATRLATAAGVVVAFVLIGLGLLQVLAGEFLGGFWLVLVGFFLRHAATSSAQQFVLRQALGSYAVRDVMTRDVVYVLPELSIAHVLGEFFWPPRIMSFPVLDRGRVVGILDLHRLSQIPLERWAEMRVHDLMHPLDKAFRTEPDVPLWEASAKLSRNDLGRLVVLDGERLVGYLSERDVIRAMALTLSHMHQPGLSGVLARIGDAHYPGRTSLTQRGMRQ